MTTDASGSDMSMETSSDASDGDVASSDDGGSEGRRSGGGRGGATAGPSGNYSAFGETMGWAEGDNDVRWVLTGNGTLTYGNSRTGGASVSSSLQLRDGPDVGVVEVSFAYGVAQAPLTCGPVLASPGDYSPNTANFCMTSGPGGVALANGARAPGFTNWNENSVNLQWRLRYDHYFDTQNSIYVAHVGRFDRFAGIVPRLSLQLAWEHILLHEDNHSFKLGLGVDGTFDLYTDSVRDQIENQVAMGATLPPTWTTQNRFMPQVLLRAVYVNHLTSELQWDSTFEAFWDVVDYPHLRFNWVNRFASRISNVLQLRLDITGRFDSRPPGQQEPWNEVSDAQTATMFELVTTLNIVGTFDLDGAPPEDEEHGHGDHGGGHGDRGGGGGGHGSGSGGGGGGGSSSRCAPGQPCLSTDSGRSSSSSSSGSSGRDSSGGGRSGGGRSGGGRSGSGSGSGSSDRQSGTGSSDDSGTSSGTGSSDGSSDSDSSGASSGEFTYETGDPY